MVQSEDQLRRRSPRKTQGELQRERDAVLAAKLGQPDDSKHGLKVVQLGSKGKGIVVSIGIF